MPLATSRQGFLQDPLGRKLAEDYAEDARRLAEIAPEIDLSVWPSVSGRT